MLQFLVRYINTWGEFLLRVSIKNVCLMKREIGLLQTTKCPQSLSKFAVTVPLPKLLFSEHQPHRQWPVQLMQIRKYRSLWPRGLTPIHIIIDEIGRVYEITQGTGTQYDKDMELENWTHPATHIKTTEGEEESLLPIQAYTDDSKSDLGVGAGVVIFLDNHIIKTMQYRLNERCINNQAEQMAILKALEYIQNMESDEKNSTGTHR